MDNVIPAFFSEEFYSGLFNKIKYGGGPKRAEAWLIAQGYHPSFVKAIMKKMIRERGW